jgi:glycine dehydrogenase subunit 2
MTVGTRGLIYNEDLIFEKSVEGRKAYSLPALDVPEVDVKHLIPEEYLREEVSGFPEVSEVEVVRHFVRLSQWNYAIDLGFYPLGSCSMKYNPKIHEDIARLPGFARIHPYQPETLSQGAIALMYELEKYLCEISGMDRVSLQPAAGAHGELTGLMMIRAYLTTQGNPRKKVIIPDSAHGTNPASTTLCGYEAISIKSNDRGCIDPKTLSEAMNEDVAAIMLTNPNTLGLFEENILDIARIVHEKGGLVYGDGANLNALLGIARPGDMGIDVIQFNLHKTFTTPHGGGGPGAGPVGIKSHLVPFMPVPTPERREEQGGEGVGWWGGEVITPPHHPTSPPYPFKSMFFTDTPADPPIVPPSTGGREAPSPLTRRVGEGPCERQEQAEQQGMTDKKDTLERPPHPLTPSCFYYLDYNRPQSVGKVRAFYGNFGMMVRAYCYIRSMGAEGLRQVAETAVINANYIMSQLRDVYHLPYDRYCKHECVFSDKFQLKNDVKTLDIAKRLMDYGFHPPTIYFPLIVHGALMIEPTETESKETLDEFIEAMRAIAREAEEEPETVRNAPHVPKVRRLDETTAARKPKLRWEKESSSQRYKGYKDK